MDAVDNEQDINYARVVRLAQKGAYGRAIAALVPDGFHKLTPAVIKELKTKHPQGFSEMHDNFNLPPRGK